MIDTTRRLLTQFIGLAVTGSVLGCASEILPKTGRRVVVVGAGFGGMTAAKQIRRLDPSIEVLLVDQNRRYVANPFSNEVIVGRRDIKTLTIDEADLGSAHGLHRLQALVTAIEPDRRLIVTPQGRLSYDVLILATGIDFLAAPIDGYDPLATPLVFPHAWQAGEQTLLLQRQVAAMADGGVILVSIPLAPYRCPGGPYERICLLAEYIQRHKPRSKLVVLDANPGIVAFPDQISRIWRDRYARQIDYLPGARVVGLHAPSHTLVTADGSAHRGDVINLIPPQGTSPMARQAGLTDEGEAWCAINSRMASLRHPDIFVIGDAAKVGDIPKTAYGANAQGKLCALNVVARLHEWNPGDFPLLNVCYAAIGTDEAISLSQVYRSDRGHPFQAVPGAHSISPEDASLARREYANAEAWLKNMLAEFVARA